MVGSALKKYAKSHNMKVNGGFAYGIVQGYAISMCDGANVKCLNVDTKFPDEEARTQFESAWHQAGNGADYRVQSMDITPEQIRIVFADLPGTMDKIGSFIDWFLPFLRQYRASDATVCSACGGMFTGEGKWVVVGDTARYMHESCVESLNRQLQEDGEAAEEASKGSYATGFVGALIGGLVGAVIWGFILKLGFVAGLVGLVIGFLAEKGYTLLKGKVGKGKVVILIAVIVIAVIVGTVFGLYLQLLDAAREVAPNMKASEVVRLVWDADPELREAFVGDAVKNGLIGLLFAGLGSFGTIAKSAGETKSKKIKVLK